MTSSMFVCLLKSHSVMPVSVETAVRPSSSSVFAHRVLLAEHQLKLPSSLWSVDSKGLIVEGVERLLQALFKTRGVAPCWTSGV